MNTIGTSTYGWNSSCKYRLPCGYCELKKEQCNWWETITVPCGGLKITPTWERDEVTCSTVEKNASQ